MRKEKIGVGLLTYNRPEYFEQTFNSVMKYRDEFDDIIIVKDGSPSYPRQYQDEVPMIEFIDNGLNCRSKNTAWSYLITQGCYHIFLIEDDIVIKQPGMFEQYIKTAKTTGIHHLMYSKVGDNPKRLTVDYEDGVGLDLHRNFQGAMMYTITPVIKKIGAWDINFKNAFTHVDWTYRCVQAGIMPPMWWSPDIKDSNLYLEAIDGSEENSSITARGEYSENYKHSAEYWVKKYGYFTNVIPDSTEDVVREKLKWLKNTYRRDT
jgi:GT2 family glycosyltransferase